MYSQMSWGNQIGINNTSTMKRNGYINGDKINERTSNLKGFEKFI
jgi:hypothetical protein